MIDLRRTPTACHDSTLLSATLILIGSFLVLVYALSSAGSVLEPTSARGATPPVSRVITLDTGGESTSLGTIAVARALRTPA